MGRRKVINNQKENISILEMLNPIISYLLKIEHHPLTDDKSVFKYIMGFPLNWVLKSNLVNFDIVNKTDKLMVVEIFQKNEEDNSDVIYNHIIEIINKNLKIDEIKEEYQEKINQLRKKYENEEKSLFEDLFNQDLEQNKTDEQQEEEDNRDK